MEALFELYFDREARVPGAPGVHVEGYTSRIWRDYEQFTTAQKE